jgi:hypothetical protein
VIYPPSPPFLKQCLYYKHICVFSWTFSFIHMARYRIVQSKLLWLYKTFWILTTWVFLFYFSKHFYCPLSSSQRKCLHFIEFQKIKSLQVLNCKYIKCVNYPVRIYTFYCLSFHARNYLPPHPCKYPLMFLIFCMKRA